MPGNEGKAAQPGLFESVRHLLHLVVQSFHVRIGIFSIELREEGQRMIRLFALTAVFILLAAVTLLLVSFTLVFAFWDSPEARMTALCTLCAAWGIGTVVAGVLISRTVQADKLPFADTLRELEKDREWVQKPKSSEPS